MCSAMKSGNAQQNLQKNTIDNINWRDQNENIYNIHSKAFHAWLTALISDPEHACTVYIAHRSSFFHSPSSWVMFPPPYRCIYIIHCCVINVTFCSPPFPRGRSHPGWREAVCGGDGWEEAAEHRLRVPVSPGGGQAVSRHDNHGRAGGG